MIPLSDKVKLKKAPLVTILLILANIVLFFLFSSESYFLKYGFIVGDFHFLNLFTSLFFHANFLHLFVNIWFLWIFGSSVEMKMGKMKFFLLYLFSGVLANLGYFFLINQDVMIPLIGASGSISGVLGAYLFLYPKNRIKTFPDFNLPAFFYIILWFALQLFFAFLGGGSFLVHILGLLAGIILILILKNV